jgi:phytoene synthase
LQGVDLDGDVRRVDPDRWLASRFIADPRARADVVALYAFDHELARASAVASTSLMAQIRLAWWSEAIAEMFDGGAVRRHPVAEALALAVRTRALPRAPLKTMIETRIGTLDKETFEPAEALAWADDTQGGLAGLAALVLGGPAEGAAPAGIVWGLMLLRRAGKAGGAAFEARLRAALQQARRAARDLPAAAFPAALCATLARADPRSRAPSELEKRARLTWAFLSGRL